MKKENRIIKFRAWDNHDKRIIYFSLATLPSYIGWELQQFTGLTDKNGKEIWEGDIIEVIDYPNGRDRKYRLKRKIIEWKECHIFTGFNITNVLSEKVEVIGNVWENGDLRRLC